jgi:hypothetical protein
MLTESGKTVTPEEHAEFEKMTAKLRRPGRVRRMAVEAVLFLVLAIGGGLLFWGGNFAKNMVHDQLSDQKISFPAKGSAALDPKEFPGLQRYAGQAVDNGPKAKAYANQFIAAHLKATAGGKTYSQVSEASRANPSDTKLAGQVQTLFRGETLRGLLLYAWGWSVVGMIATYVAYAAFAGAVIILIALGYALFRPQHACGCCGPPSRSGRRPRRRPFHSFREGVPVSMLLTLLASVLSLVAVAALMMWFTSIVTRGLDEPTRPFAASPTPPPKPAPLTVQAIVVLWSEHDDVAVLDCVRADGPHQGAPFATSAAIPAHPTLATATENLLDRWCTTGTPISITAVAGRRGPELRLSDGDAWMELAVAS